MKNETTTLRVLVVDDDALSRDVLALLLEHAGYVVATADSGDAAVRHLSATPAPPPDVVLADIQMPGLTGNALAHALRQLCGTSTLLLAMSGSRPYEEVIREFDGLLLKPFTVEELAAAITEKSSFADTLDEMNHQGLDPLDEHICEKLAVSMRRGRLQQLYALCLRDTEERIARMRKIASNGDDVAFRKEAHAIKGGAGMVGAIELQMLAATMEQDGIHANHIASLDGLTFALERLRRILMARNIIEEPGTA